MDEFQKIACSVASIAYLNATHSYACLSADTQYLVAAAMHYLDNMCTNTRLVSKQSHDLLTWRPTFCIDVVILPPRSGKPAALIVMLHGFESRAQLFQVVCWRIAMTKRVFFAVCLLYNSFHLKCHNSLNHKKVKARAQKVFFRINPRYFWKKPQKETCYFPSFLIFVFLTIVTF